MTKDTFELEKIMKQIEDEHAENHGYPISTKRKYYAMRAAILMKNELEDQCDQCSLKNQSSNMKV